MTLDQYEQLLGVHKLLEGERRKARRQNTPRTYGQQPLNARGKG